MIRYALKCRHGHRFESWFQSARAFDALAAGGHLTCPECGTTEVTKALMAPSVAAEAEAPMPAPSPLPANGAAPAQVPSEPPSTPLPPRVAQAMAKLRAFVEARSDYVGTRFVTEVRQIRDGDAEERPIHGEASPDDVRELLDEGVPLLPLPFRDRRSNN